MTDRLYYTDSYLREFEGIVVDSADGGRRVYLDRTAFYPTSGGQSFDRGRLGGSEVVDVVDEEDRIAHVLDAPLAGGQVTGRIDWPRRLDHMQQHTGQHLLSAVIAELFRHATVSVHFGEESSTLDLDTGTIAPGQVAEAERRANEVAMENRAVGVTFEDASTAAGLRKATKREGILRIVTIEGLDRSACGGTHVRATGEVGPILIRKVERVKQLVRMEFLCGGRAVRRSRADADLLAALSASASAAPDDLPGVLEHQRTEHKQALAESRRLDSLLATYRAAELYAAAAPTPDGRHIVIVREADGPVDRLRTLGMAVARLPGAVFLAVVETPPAILLATADDSRMDAGGALKKALGQVGGRGGGNPRLAQGSVPDEGALDAVVQALSSGPGAG